MRGTAINRTRGFTLLEVMLAFVLLAAAMGLLVGMLSNGTRQVRQAQDETEATLHAQTLIDQIGILEPIVPGVVVGEFEKGRYRYRLDIAQVPDPVPAPDGDDGRPATTPEDGPVVGGPMFYRIALDVSWGDAAPAQQLHFATLRARVPGADAVLSP